MKIIIGLGNIGKNYESTRHNAGFLAIDKISEEFDPENKEKFKEDTKLLALKKEIQIKNEKMLLLKPTTFMNLSGATVEKAINYYKVGIEDIFVIFDDIDLEFGQVRFREKGSAGTHNGMKSIIEKIKTENFKRIKIGIENRSEREKKFIPLNEYVLSKFSKEEQLNLSDIMDKMLSMLLEELKPKDKK